MVSGPSSLMISLKGQTKDVQVEQSVDRAGTSGYIAATVISETLNTFRQSVGQNRAGQIYPTEYINHEIKSELQSLYRIQDNVIIAGAVNNVSSSNLVLKTFDYGFVFTEYGVIIRLGNPEWTLINPPIKILPWNDLKALGRISWTDNAIDLGYKKIDIKATGLTSAEISRLFSELASLAR
jgi:hypothetical protein